MNIFLKNKRIFSGLLCLSLATSITAPAIAGPSTVVSNLLESTGNTTINIASKIGSLTKQAFTKATPALLALQNGALSVKNKALTFQHPTLKNSKLLIASTAICATLLGISWLILQINEYRAKINEYRAKNNDYKQINRLKKNFIKQETTQTALLAAAAYITSPLALGLGALNPMASTLLACKAAGLIIHFVTLKKPYFGFFQSFSRFLMHPIKTILMPIKYPLYTACLTGDSDKIKTLLYRNTENNNIMEKKIKQLYERTFYAYHKKVLTESINKCKEYINASPDYFTPLDAYLSTKKYCESTVDCMLEKDCKISYSCYIYNKMVLKNSTQPKNQKFKEIFELLQKAKILGFQYEHQTNKALRFKSDELTVEQALELDNLQNEDEIYNYIVKYNKKISPEKELVLYLFDKGNANLSLEKDKLLFLIEKKKFKIIPKDLFELNKDVFSEICKDNKNIEKLKVNNFDAKYTKYGRSYAVKNLTVKSAIRWTNIESLFKDGHYNKQTERDSFIKEHEDQEVLN